MSSEIRSLIVVSDLHCGCQHGLTRPEPQHLDGGGTYHPSDLQRKVWSYWEAFWNEWVPVAVRHRNNFAVLINGDTTDGVHHGTKTQITQNLTDQSKIAQRILEPIVERCHGNFFMIRGTEAHVGKSGENEEALAKSLGAVPQVLGHDEEGNPICNYARWDMNIRIVEGLVNATHHISTTSSLQYETTALMKEYAIACAEAGQWGRESPDFVVRSHRHRFASVEVPIKKGKGGCVVTPGWQLKTPLVHRIPGGRQATPQFGGVVFNAGDEDKIYMRSQFWVISPTPETNLNENYTEETKL